VTEIREQRLYLESHTSFEAYCKERWGFSKPYASRLIQSAELAKQVPIGTCPLPNEAVARELAPLKAEPEKLRETWEQVTRENPKPTARA
jgi:hypothetical protein